MNLCILVQTRMIPYICLVPGMTHLVVPFHREL